jgi:WD40 repeat protein
MLGRVSLGAPLVLAFLFSVPAVAGSATATHRVLHDADIDSAVFSRTGAILATVDRGSLRFWDTATGDLKAEFKAAPDMRFWRVLSIENGRFLLIGNDGVEVYDLERPRLVARLGHGYVRSIDYDFKSKRVLTLLALGGTAEKNVNAPPDLALYDVRDILQGSWFANAWRAVFGADEPDPVVDIRPRPIRQKYANPNNYYAAHFLSNPDEVLTFGLPETIVWSLSGRREKRSISTKYSFGSHVSPDRSRFVTCSFNSRSLELWSIEPGESITSLDIPGYTRNCRFRRDGSTLAVETQYSSKFMETVWRLDDGKKLEAFELDADTRGNAHTWSEDGKRYVVAGPGWTLRVYEEDDDPVAIGTMAPGLVLTEKLRRGPPTYSGVSGDSLYVSPTGKQALWVMGVQAILWQLP